MVALSAAARTHAGRNRLSMIGFLFVLLGTATGIGGGTIRDTLINALPVFWVTGAGLPGHLRAGLLCDILPRPHAPIAAQAPAVVRCRGHGPVRRDRGREGTVGRSGACRRHRDGGDYRHLRRHRQGYLAASNGSPGKGASCALSTTGRRLLARTGSKGRMLRPSFTIWPQSGVACLQLQAGESQRAGRRRSNRPGNSQAPRTACGATL